MMDLIYNETSDTVCVYNADDFEKLRNDHRIVGELIGNTQFTPMLPLQLIPEAALFVVNKGLAKLVTFKKLRDSPDEDDRKVCQVLEDALLTEEQHIYRSLRKRELTQVIDKIVAGKRKKGDARSKEEILEEELNKSSSVTKESMIWPVFTEHADLLKGTSTEVPVDVLLSSTTKTKCAVYADLWEKGYWVTVGNKFGGDFLAYLGDPSTFHAAYIVRCVENGDSSIHASELVAFGRLGTAVKKKPLFAFLDTNGKVFYITLCWVDM